jgi:hypothetical protein
MIHISFHKEYIFHGLFTLSTYLEHLHIFPSSLPASPAAFPFPLPTSSPSRVTQDKTNIRKTQNLKTLEDFKAETGAKNLPKI